MWAYNLFFLSLKQLKRHWIRTILTILGTSCGMFLYLSIETFQAGLKNATEANAGDDTLVVYRDKRFCPYTSRLPEYYGPQIAKIPGVKSVTPIKILVNHCGTSLDTVTFRGIPKEKASDFFTNVTLISGDFNSWYRSNDAAILGSELAKRRGVEVGEFLDAAGVTVRVVGILDSKNPQDLNVAYVQLDFIQKASSHGLGTITQFNVKVSDYRLMNQVASNIDTLFQHAQEPTHTRPEKTFIAQVAKDMISLISFTRWLGFGAVIAVCFLVVNTVVLAVRGRTKEIAVMQAIGFNGEHIFLMILLEGILLGVIGGFLGSSLALILLEWGHFSISSEGLSILFQMDKIVLLKALIISILIGLISGIYPSFSAFRGQLAIKLRKV